jgi:hypothetical protein
MKKIFLLLLLHFILIDSSAQQIDWVRRIGGDHGSDTRAVAVDQEGNVYTSGSFVYGNMDFNPDGGGDVFSASSALFITKRDSAGNYIWTKVVEGNWSATNSGYSIDVDHSGNIYITGTFQGPIDFDPGIGVHSISASYSYMQLFILKLDANGNFKWVNTYTGNAGYNIGSDIKVTPDYEVYVVGCYGDTVDFDPGPGVHQLISNGATEIFVTKIDSAGNFIWASSIGGAGGEDAEGIEIDQNKNVFITGIYSDFADFDPGPGIFYVNTGSPTQTDVFTAKLDSTGGLLWVKPILNIGDDYVQHLVIDNDGSVYKTGKFAGSPDFDPGIGIHTLTAAANTHDLYIVKLDGDGNFIWVKQIAGTEPSGCSAQSIAFDGNYIYTTGYMLGQFDFDPGPGDFSLSYSYPYGFGMFLNAIDTSGNFGGALLITGPGDNRPMDIKFDENRNIYLTGNYAGVIDLDSLGYPDDLWALDSSGIIQSSFIMKLTHNNIGIEPEELTKYSVYPNPTESIITLSSESTFQNAILVITDINGKILIQKNQLNGNNFHLDLNELNPGMYFFHWYSEGKEGVIKVVKN